MHAIVLMCCGLLVALPGLAAERDSQPNGYILERAVLVMRHGVRPPTKSAQAMAELSDRPWPDNAAWGAEPGELTPHGAQAIALLGADLRSVYAAAGLLPVRGSIADRTLFWADGADQRTRATAQFLATGLNGSEQQAITVAWSHEPDPLFDALGHGTCQLEPVAALQAVAAQANLETPQIRQELGSLQAVLAPQACEQGAGSCLAGTSKLGAARSDVKISGPLAIAATVSEALLLEYENGLPMSQVGFGRVNADQIRRLLAIHDHTANLTRRTPYIALRRASAMLQFIVTALSEPAAAGTVPLIRDTDRLIVLTGHDTNLSNLAGALGLDWQLPDQPDATAPGSTIAFERWRNQRTGQAELRMRLFYQGMEDVRQLAPKPARQLALHSPLCDAAQTCSVAHVTERIQALLPVECHLR